jgi:hypothetical protein
VVAGLAVAAAPVLLLGVIWMARQAADPPGAEAGEIVRVGVVQGQSVSAYLSAAHDGLAALPPGEPVWALVSLDEYVAPGRLPELLGGAAVAQVYARVPLAGSRTQVVRLTAGARPADVEAGLAEAADERDQERAQYLRLAEAVRGSGTAQDRARKAYVEAADLAGGEALSYRAGCACVFAAVVRADVAGLTGVAGRSGVRAVDPAPEVRSLDRADFRAPLPEQTGTVPPDPTSTPIADPNGRSAIASAPPPPLLSASAADVTSASSDAAARRPSDISSKERPAVPSR